MVSTCRPEDRPRVQLELRKPLRPKSYQAAVVRPGAHVGEIDLVAAHQQLDAEYAAAAERVDDARGDRLRRIQRWGGQLLRLPCLQQVAVAVAVADRLAEVQRGPGRAGGADGDQGDLAVDLDDRLGEHPVVRDTACGHRALPGRLDVVDAQQHRLALARQRPRPA